MSSSSFVIFFSLSGIVESSFTEQPETSIAFCRENDNSRRKKLCNAGTGIKNRPLPEGRGLLAYPYDINNLQWIAGDSCKPQCTDGLRCPNRFYVRLRREKTPDMCCPANVRLPGRRLPASKLVMLSGLSCRSHRWVTPISIAAYYTLPRRKVKEQIVNNYSEAGVRKNRTANLTLIPLRLNKLHAHRTSRVNLHFG